MISEIPLADFGLMTVEDAARRKKWSVRTVQKWILTGLLPAVVAGKGRRCVYLLRPGDVDAFQKPKLGRPALTDKKPAKKRIRKPKAKPKAA